MQAIVKYGNREKVGKECMFMYLGLAHLKVTPAVSNPGF